jgi:hypothetical protein
LADLLVVFSGIHQTLEAEGALQRFRVPVDLIPTPVAITLGCGFSILTSEDAGGPNLPVWWYELKTQRVLYQIVLKEGQKRYEEIGRCEGFCLPPAGDHVPKDPGGGGAR